MQKKEIQLRQASVVVVAEHNNPSILNPDFLRHNNIVPDEISSEIVQPSISTPAFSQIKYSRIEIQSDINRITFLENMENTEGFMSPQMVKKYVKTVPLVRYAALGINFMGTLSPAVKNAGQLISQRFVCEEGLRQFKDSDSSAQVNLSYNVRRKKINFSISEDQDNNIQLQANNHRDVQGNGQDSFRVIAGLVEEEWEKDFEDFNEFANIILGKLP